MKAAEPIDDMPAPCCLPPLCPRLLRSDNRAWNGDQAPFVRYGTQHAHARTHARLSRARTRARIRETAVRVFTARPSGRRAPSLSTFRSHSPSYGASPLGRGAADDV
jgi:hypothetical protein